MSAKRKVESDSRAANRPRVMKSHGNSRADSERDSGFSDASSEHTGTMDNTDSDDSPRPFVRPGTRTPASRQLAVVGGSYSGMSPMIIMNNVLLKQPGDNPPAMKPWSFSPSVEVVQQPQVVFLQPVVSRQTSKEASRHRRPKKYLPILKSYPKIAPHPGDSSSSSSSSGRGTVSSSSSTSSSSSLSSSSASGSQREPSQIDGLPGSQDNVRPPQTRLSEAPSPAIDSSEFPPPAEGEPDDDVGDTRRKRFCNTYNILSKSGLLDITLRTKELLRQNRRTQTDLDRLREHTDLFLQALRSGDAGICAKLQASLQEEDGKRTTLTGLKDD